MQRLCTLLALATAPTLSLAAQQSIDVDFESGTLGWSGPMGATGTSGINPTGGVDGGAGFQVDFSDFFITVRNGTNPAFLGDYTLFDSLTLSHELRVDEIEFFFSPVPRPWLIELRNFDLAQGGFPWTSVWFKFDDISAATHGDWTTFSVTIDDPLSTTLPAGWKGYGAEDPTTFEPILPAGVTFADVLAGVDEVALTTGEPGFFFGQTNFDLTIDNLSVATTGGPWSDLQSGLAGAAGVPQLYAAGSVAPGSPTAIGLSNAAPNAATFLVVGFSQVNQPLFGGTLVPSADIAVLSGQTDAVGAQPLGLPWPAGLASGTDIYWQYWVIDPSGPFGVTASNGLVCTTP
ncbi:MAG: hypothetical protein AAF682_00030 [Planctomycetota bacterium]